MEKYQFKIILGGCVGSVRTEIITQYTSGNKHSGTRMIIGVDFAVHSVNLPEENAIAILQLWDFGEEPRFRSLIPCFCRGAAGAILYFDLNDIKTLYDLEEWIYQIREYSPDNIPILICGVKSHNNIEEEISKIDDFVKKHNLNGYFDIELQSGCNICEGFEDITAIMVKQWNRSVNRKSCRNKNR